jgi:undecaprenyl-diphosphatase
MLLKAVIQGLAEFLPISSTAHLIFSDAIRRELFHEVAQAHTGLAMQQEAFFDIWLHMGTLLAVLIYFRRELGVFFRAIVLKPRNTGLEPAELFLARNIFLKLLIAFFVSVGTILVVLKISGLIMGPMGLLGPEVEDLSDYYLKHPQFVAIHLVGTGILLTVAECFTKRQPAVPVETSDTPPTLMQQIGNIPLKSAVAVGLAQSWAAIFHGFSRSGTTMCAGMFSGLNKAQAAKFTFLLSIPTFLAAMVYECLKLRSVIASAAQTTLVPGQEWSILLGSFDWFWMVIAMLVAAVVGYVCVAFFIQFISRRSLMGFAIYCWLVAAGMFWLVTT